MPQGAPKGSKFTQAFTQRRNHVRDMRNITSAPPQARHPNGETQMRSLRATTKKALLPAIAMAALLTGLSTAKAWDQQATGAEMDYELSQQAAGNDRGSFAQVPSYEGRGFTRHYRGER
jgi:hypothetical protein